MIKVLIVEDEVLARLGLHQLVDWKSMGFELLEDAKNGTEALAKIEALRPQIIILDLNIPEVNGIEIQKYISEHNIGCYTVIVSCNDEFSTVKDVMRLGAFDFLRKLNLSGEALTAVLNRCKTEIEGRAISDDKRCPPSEEKLCAYESLFKSKTNTVCVGEYRSAACLVPQYGELVMHDAIDVCMYWLDREGVDYRLIYKSDKGIYLLLAERQNEVFFERLHDRMEQLWKTVVHISVYEGDIKNLEDINAAFAITECTYVYAYYDLPRTVFHVSEKQAFLTSCPLDFNTCLSRLKLALANFSEREICQAIDALFDELRTREMLAENILKRMFMDILSLYSATAQRLHGALEEVYLNGENYHYQTIIRLNSLNLSQQWFISLTKVFIEEFFVRYKSTNSDILFKTLNYIENNISQPIQLAAVAKDIGISEAYLSSYFKKEIGQNFIAYVNARKVSKAKELMQNGFLVCQASESLGFDNYTYFSKMFKKYTGMSPGAYRKKACVRELQSV